MVEIEQRIYGDVPNVRGWPSENVRTQDKPLGDHFGPGTQFGPAFGGHEPSRSLLIGMSDPNGTETCSDVPQNHLMNSCMGTFSILEKVLETNKVSGETVHHILDALGSDESVEGLGYARSSIR